ncbi:MAG: redoxin family protein [Actinobacteria bacterium]|nr:redoxin family protein [Actinomycetota bacterium]
MTGSTHKRDPHGGADPYSKLAEAQSARKRTPWIIGGAAVVVLILALIAVLVTTSSDDSSGTAAAGTGAAAAKDAKQETAKVEVKGASLVQMPSPAGDSPFTSASTDPAIGRQAPTLVGESFDRSKVTIDPTDGIPKVIMFVAHWCPHCQREVPLIQKWIAAGNLPKGVEIVTVSTAVADDRPNYPPSAWIAKEGWQPKVMADDGDGTAAQAYGLPGFPYFVMTNGKGEVVARGSGEVPIDQFAAAVDALAKGQPISAGA